MKLLCFPIIQTHFLPAYVILLAVGKSGDGDKALLCVVI